MGKDVVYDSTGFGQKFQTNRTIPDTVGDAVAIGTITPLVYLGFGARIVVSGQRISKTYEIAAHYAATGASWTTVAPIAADKDNTPAAMSDEFTLEARQQVGPLELRLKRTGTKQIITAALQIDIRLDGDFTTFAPSTATTASAAVSGGFPGVVAVPTNGTHAARIAITTPSPGRSWKETDTGLLYVGNATASGWDILRPDGHVYKTADETVNNNGTPQNDDHLLFPIEANERWFVEAFLWVNAASVNADWLFGWALPASATANWSNSSGVNSAFVNVATGSSPTAPKIAGQTVADGALAADHIIGLAGWFTAAATAGTVNLQWSQSAATAENNKVLAGSFLRLRRLA